MAAKAGAVCARGGDTSSRRWLQSWPRFQHHSAPRGPRTARTGGRARVEVHGRVPEDALPQAAGAVYFEMDTGEDDGFRTCRRAASTVA